MTNWEKFLASLKSQLYNSPPQNKSGAVTPPILIAHITTYEKKDITARRCCSGVRAVEQAADTSGIVFCTPLPAWDWGGR